MKPTLASTALAALLLAVGAWATWYAVTARLGRTAAARARGLRTFLRSHIPGNFGFVTMPAAAFACVGGGLFVPSPWWAPQVGVVLIGIGMLLGLVSMAVFTRAVSAALAPAWAKPAIRGEAAPENTD